MVSKPDAPQPPNPAATAAAQTGTNVGTAIANSILGNVNQNTPTGSLQYNQTGDYSWTDPYTGSQYTIPSFTATQILSDQQQAIQDQIFATQFNTAGLANQQSAALSQHLAQPFSISGAPAAGDPGAFGQYANRAQGALGPVGGQMQYSVPSGGTVLQDFRQTTPVQHQFDPTNFQMTNTYQDFAGERNRVEAGLMERLNPQLGLERSRGEQQLADQGIRYGSPAYQNAMDQYSRQANDARLAVIGQAGAEQQRMSDMAAQRAGFQNAAQQQEYNQLLGRAQYWNAGAGQEFGQEQARAQFHNAGELQQFQEYLAQNQFANAAQQQSWQQAMGQAGLANQALAQNFAMNESAFNASNAARNQYLAEQYQLRNQPINEVASLMAGSQVSQPSFINANSVRIPTTDIAGIINQNFQQQMGIYQQQSQNANQLMGGLFGMAGGILRSDERVKENIQPMGSVMTTEDKSLPIYSYAYKDDPTAARRVGPMAQDVEKLRPGAVLGVGGVKHIKRAKLGSLLGVGHG